MLAWVEVHSFTFALCDTSNAITKVLEFVLYDRLVNKLPIDDYQFGFKVKHSTGLCTRVLSHDVLLPLALICYVILRRLCVWSSTPNVGLI